MRCNLVQELAAQPAHVFRLHGTCHCQHATGAMQSDAYTYKVYISVSTDLHFLLQHAQIMLIVILIAWCSCGAAHVVIVSNKASMTAGFWGLTGKCCLTCG